MARIFGNNWACKIVRQKMDAGASAKEIAQALAAAPQFVDAIDEGISNDTPNMPGGDGAEGAIGNLLMKLEEAGTMD